MRARIFIRYCNNNYAPSRPLHYRCTASPNTNDRGYADEECLATCQPAKTTGCKKFKPEVPEFKPEGAEYSGKAYVLGFFAMLMIMGWHPQQMPGDAGGGAAVHGQPAEEGGPGSDRGH